MPGCQLSTRLSERRGRFLEDQDQTDTTTEANLDGAIAGAAAVAGAVAGAGTSCGQRGPPPLPAECADDERDAAFHPGLDCFCGARVPEQSTGSTDEELFGPMPTATEMPSPARTPCPS